MKILIIHWLYEPHFLGGGERVVQTLAEGLVAAGHEVVVVTTVPGRRTLIAHLKGVKVYYVGLRNVYWYLNAGAKRRMLKPLWHIFDLRNGAMAREVARILDVERPTIVHSHGLEGFSTAVWQPVRDRRLPCVHSMHSYYLLCPRASMFRRGENCSTLCGECRMFGAVRRRMAASLDAVVGCSQFIMNRHLDYSFFAQTTLREVVYYGYAPLAPRTERPQRSGKLRVGYLGRLDPTKGVELLIRAAAPLLKHGCELRIAGKGSDEYEQQLKKHASADIRFMGFARTEAFLSEVDVLVVPSLWNDPCPLVIIEAFAQGVPIIGSNRGGIPERVDEDKTGFVFAPEHPETLTALLERFISERDLVARMRVETLKRSSELSPQRMVDDYLAVYGKALGATPHRREGPLSQAVGAQQER
jgi:glycosyltransferase involved in cell wall biosynthesis